MLSVLDPFTDHALCFPFVRHFASILYLVILLPPSLVGVDHFSFAPSLHTSTTWRSGGALAVSWATMAWFVVIPLPAPFLLRARTLKRYSLPGIRSVTVVLVRDT